MACCILIASLVHRGLRAVRRRGGETDAGAWRLTSP
jgi:hypothetical protein